jgi:hypothetical protein
MELTTDGVNLPAIVGSSRFVVRETSIDRSYDGFVELKFEGLPPGVAIKTENGRGGRITGQVDFICDITGPADLAPGVHAFDIIAAASLGRAQEFRLAKVPLRVVEAARHRRSSDGAHCARRKTGSGRRIVTRRRIPAHRRDAASLPLGITGRKVTVPPAPRRRRSGSSPAGRTEGKFNTLVLAATTRVKRMEVASKRARPSGDRK